MSRMIFVNLPVEDLGRSRRFYEALGFRNEPKFTNEQAAAMVLTDVIHVMLLTKPFYAGFTAKPIANAHQSSQVLLCISCDSRAEVDRFAESAGANGGRTDPGPKQDISGMMYSRSFEDPDGHHWEPMWMDSAAAEQGASAFDAANAL
ncbi:MAG: VOC family protein [Sphingomicrobium sp.]